MLTKKAYFRAAKQLQGFGELPPSYVDLQSWNFTGPAQIEAMKSTTEPEAGAIEVSLSIERDGTGELRVILT